MNEGYKFTFELGDRVSVVGAPSGVITHTGRDLAGEVYLVRHYAENEVQERWYREGELSAL